MPARRSGAGAGSGTVRRKHSLGNLRRAHPASGATWNVQVVRGKMSSKCLWHACRALVLGLTLMLLGAGMATIGYYADYLSMGSELRGNATVRVKNDLKGFHLNNFSYVGPIVMGFGGFIVVASCVMTFEARDSAAKVVPARLRAGGTGSKTTVRSNQSSATSQRRAIGLQLQSNRWDQHFGVFRPSPSEPAPQTSAPLDRDALTAELIKFSKSLSASARFSPQLRRLTYTGSVPNLSTLASHHPLAYSTNISHLLSPNHKPLLLLEHKRHHRHHRHHHRHHHVHVSAATNNNNIITSNNIATTGTTSGTGTGTVTNLTSNCSGRHVKSRGTRISNSLIQRTTRESCTLLQPPANRVFWHASSFDESGRLEKQLARNTERNKRSDTAKRHVLARQKPIEHEHEEGGTVVGGSSPLGNRRSSTMSDSSYSGRWTVRCASIASRTSSIDSRRIQVDLHSPEVLPKSILRSPKRYNSGPSATPSVEKEFRSQLSVCSEPPATVRQLSGQSSVEPCLPEELNDVEHTHSSFTELTEGAEFYSAVEMQQRKPNSILKKPRPDTLPLQVFGGTAQDLSRGSMTATAGPSVSTVYGEYNRLQRSNSSRTFYRPKPQISKEHDDSIFYIRSVDRSGLNSNDLYDSLQVINERRSTLLRADSETALAERKLSNCSFSLMQEIPERNSQNTSLDIEDADEQNAGNTEVRLQLDGGPAESSTGT